MSDLSDKARELVKLKEGMTPGPWDSRGSVSVHKNGTMHPIGPDQTRQDGESWLDMRRRIQPLLKACENECQANARAVASLPDLMDTLEALLAENERLRGAVNGIAPWLSASLCALEPGHDGSYEAACDRVFECAGGEPFAGWDNELIGLSLGVRPRKALASLGVTTRKEMIALVADPAFESKVLSVRGAGRKTLNDIKTARAALEA